ncbi:ATP-binding cassette domain-containing protein [Leifsonia sp. ZF2019]|nr:ATP-binding cassette domain-containing protein [Leifsonia sp. ZF2019]
MLVTLEGVGHRFGEAGWLFRGLDFQFHPGETYALTGPSSSGKSTLLSLLARLARPCEGRIRFDGVHRVNWVFQNPFGSARRTALDHVTLPLLTRGASMRSAERQAHDLLARFELAEVAQRPFGELSGGEAQRLMLARGLASQPDLLLIDEPTAQLDAYNAERVDAAIAATAESDVIVIVATHDPRTTARCSVRLDLRSLPGGRAR